MLREEHDRVFDKGFDRTLEMLRENPGLIKDLKYTTAVIYEALRLFPIGMVVRQPPDDMYASPLPKLSSYLSPP